MPVPIRFEHGLLRGPAAQESVVARVSGGGQDGVCFGWMKKPLGDLFHSADITKVLYIDADFAILGN